MYRDQAEEICARLDFLAASGRIDPPTDAEMASYVIAPIETIPETPESEAEKNAPFTGWSAGPGRKEDRTMARKGDARAAAEKAADRFAAAKLSGRRFSLTGAWAGSDWICNCPGRLNHGDKRRCYGCELNRPSMRHWMAQSLRWGEIAAAEHLQAARDYVSSVLFTGVFHGGPWDTAGYEALLETVARERHVDVDKLR